MRGRVAGAAHMGLCGGDRRKFGVSLRTIGRHWSVVTGCGTLTHVFHTDISGCTTENGLKGLLGT